MPLDRVGNHIVARLLLILGDEAPPFLTKMPVHHGEGDDVFQALELAGNECAVGLVTLSDTVETVRRIRLTHGHA